MGPVLQLSPPVGAGEDTVTVTVVVAVVVVGGGVVFQGLAAARIDKESRK